MKRYNITWVTILGVVVIAIVVNLPPVAGWVEATPIGIWIALLLAMVLALALWAYLDTRGKKDESSFS